VTATIEVTMDALDAEVTADFWQEALGYPHRYRHEPYVVLVPDEGDGRPRLVIQGVDAVTPGKTPVHVDLRVDDPDAEVERLRAIGATVEWVVDDTASGGIQWTTMADPWGILFCVCPARKE
jgi:catechol 2,3-dioxygenase-like lactoylglutathione lyase family enzyme